MDHSFFDGMATRCERTLEVKPVDAATIDFEHAENKIPQVRQEAFYAAASLALPQISPLNSLHAHKR